MSKSDKVYKIIDCASGDVLYQCLYVTEANRVFDLIRSIKPEQMISMTIVLRKA